MGSPRLPLHGMFVYPVQGLFAVFEGKLAHAVLPPLEKELSKGERVTLLINWWERRPGAPACEEVPPELNRKHFLPRERRSALENAALPGDDAAQIPANISSLGIDEAGRSSHFSTFGNEFQVPLLAPSAHPHGQVIAIPWWAIANATVQLHSGSGSS